MSDASATDLRPQGLRRPLTHTAGAGHSLDGNMVTTGSRVLKTT